MDGLTSLIIDNFWLLNLCIRDLKTGRPSLPQFVKLFHKIALFFKGYLRYHVCFKLFLFYQMVITTGWLHKEAKR